MNQLKVNQRHNILALYDQGWSKRRIARELGLDRATVRKYLAGAEAKPATDPHTGSGSAPEPKPATNPHTGSTPRSGPLSVCEPWRVQIEQGLAQGLSIQRLYQDLVAGQQFQGSYSSVRRFAVQRVGKQELPFRRMECAAGHEVQVDFGQGAWVIQEGKRRRPHLFRVVLNGVCGGVFSTDLPTGTPRWSLESYKT